MTDENLMCFGLSILVVIIILMFLVFRETSNKNKKAEPSTININNSPSSKFENTLAPNGDEILMEAIGVNGTVQLLENKIRITRPNNWNTLILQGLKGDKEILLHNISSIQLKMPGVLNGYIQFSFMGGLETKSGIFDATRDENTVMFPVSQQQAFLLIKKAIEEKVIQLQTSKNYQEHVSGLDEIEKLASLREKGILTEEEFRLKKKQLLGL